MRNLSSLTKIASRRKHIVFAFKNIVDSEQEAVLSGKFLLCIQKIYNLSLSFLKSIKTRCFGLIFLAFECVEYVNMAT